MPRSIRLERIARGLCRSAGYDPDQVLQPTAPVLSPHAEPMGAPAPAWQWFQKTAIRHQGFMDELASTASDLSILEKGGSARPRQR